MSDAESRGAPAAGAVTTATTEGARAHARAQAGTLVEHMVSVPPSTYPAVTADIDASRLVWAERLAGGGYAGRVVARGTTIRFCDVEGDACAHLLLYRADSPWERLCVADTVKVQWQVYLGAGQLLLSDQGRVLASVVTDTSGRHDTVCGTSSRLRNEERYGAGEAHSASPSGRDLFTLAAAKHGLGPRDLPPSLSLFKGVRVDPERGTLQWLGSAQPGSVVEIRAEVPLVVLVANTAHPIDPRPTWQCGTLEVLAWPGRPTAPGEWPWNVSPETERAFANTAADLAARTGDLGASGMSA